MTAPSLKEAFGQMLRDARSEAPDVINAVHRYLVTELVNPFRGPNVAGDEVLRMLRWTPGKGKHGETDVILKLHTQHHSFMV